MTSLTSRALTRRPPRAGLLHPAVALTLRRWAAAWRRARERRRTRAILASLDRQLLDDIGVAPHKPGLEWAFVHGVAVPLPALDRPEELRVPRAGDRA